MIMAVVCYSLAFAYCLSAAPPKTVQAPKAGQVTIFYPKPSHDSELARALRAAVEVTVDGQKAGIIDVGKPLTVTVPAGVHKLNVEHAGAFNFQFRRQETAINVSPGKTSYFYIYHSPAAVLATEVDAATAQAEISGINPKAPAGTATVVLYWPAALLELSFLKSDFDFFIGGKRIGRMTSGDYITAKVPAGRQTLIMGDGVSLFTDGLKEEVILGAGMTYYYMITKRKYMEFYQLSADQVGPDLKGLRLR